jgi:transmembrane sensor
MVMTLPTSPPSRRSRAEAAAWLARLHADDRDASDDAGFRAWLNQHPDNSVAFGAVTAAWDVAGAATRETVEPGLSRRKLLSGSVAAGLAAAGFIGWQAAFAGVHETGIGEQRNVLLDDGTRLLLDTDTKLRVAATGGMQRITLARGRFACWPARRDKGSVVVEAGDAKILAKAQSFDVSYLGGELTLYCEGGPALVLAAQGAAVDVKEGTRLVREEGRAPHMDTPAGDTLVAWRDGQLAFDDVPLAEAAEQLNRYSRDVIMVDGSAADLRLSGLYSAGDNRAFARSVALLLPVEVTTGDGRIRISGKNSQAQG